MFYIFAYVDADAPIQVRDITMLIEDGNGASVEFTFDEGNFQHVISRDWTYRPNRGRIGPGSGATVTQNDDQPMALTFEGRYSKYKSVADAKPYEILSNSDSNYTTVDEANCATYCTNITITNAPDCGDDEVLLFPEFRLDEASFSIRDGQISFSGRCNAVEPTKVS